VTLHYEGDLTTLPYSEDNNYDYASRLNGDVELNLTNITVDAYNSKNYYKTEVADYWQVTLYEDEAHRSGVKIFLAFLACKDYERWWDIDYRSVDISKVGANGNPNDFMNSFIVVILRVMCLLHRGIRCSMVRVSHRSRWRLSLTVQSASRAMMMARRPSSWTVLTMLATRLRVQ
jgi:hypothetical protein